MFWSPLVHDIQSDCFVAGGGGREVRKASYKKALFVENTGYNGSAHGKVLLSHS